MKRIQPISSATENSPTYVNLEKDIISHKKYNVFPTEESDNLFGVLYLTVSRINANQHGVVIDLVDYCFDYHNKVQYSFGSEKKLDRKIRNIFSSIHIVTDRSFIDMYSYAFELVEVVKRDYCNHRVEDFYLRFSEA